MPASNEEVMKELARLRTEIQQLREVVSARFHAVFEEGDEDWDSVPEKDEFNLYSWPEDRRESSCFTMPAPGGSLPGRGNQTIWLSCRIRSIAPRQNAPMSRKAMRTASARTKPRSNTPVRNHERRLTATRISTRTVKIVKSLVSPARAFSIVSHADGAVDTIESTQSPPSIGTSRKEFSNWDVGLFGLHPNGGGRKAISGAPFRRPGGRRIGTVGRKSFRGSASRASA